MKYIDKQLGIILFERIEENISNTTLSPKERIPKYRSILDDLFKGLTNDINQHIYGLSARSIYIFKEYDIPKNIINYTHSLRKFANKVVHETDFTPTKTDDLRSVYQLAEVIAYFSKSKIPEKIFNYYKLVLDDIKKERKFQKSVLPFYDFYAVIEDVYVPKGEYADKFCVLICNTDSLGVIKLKLWNNKNENGFGSDLSVFGKLAERYQNIYVTQVRQYKDKESEYYATEKSFIILEPDYIIDAKELSDCRQMSRTSFGLYEDNPLLYIFNRFTQGQITDRIMIGNIVGKMLDDIVIKKDNYNFRDTFETVMRENSFGMLCIANEDGSYNRGKIQSIYIESQEHEPHLKEVLSQYNNEKIILEPTFISNKYGLQGRLDMLIDYGNDNNRKDIIELKSSKNYPNTNIGLFFNHEAQTMCYDLLISSTYPSRIGNSSILYSNAPIQDKPLRNVAGEKYLIKQDLLMLRNRIVASELQLAKGNYTPFFEILSDSFGSYPVYLKPYIEDFTNTIDTLDETVQKYFLGFLKFIYRELEVAKIGSNSLFNKSSGFAELWRASKADKIESYDVLTYLEVKEVTPDFYLTLEIEKTLFTSNINVSSFRVGDTAILYPTPDPDELHPLKSQILKCYVREVNNNSITISLINKQIDKSYFKSYQYWALDRDFRETGYKKLLQQLYQFIKSDKRVIDLVLGISKPEFTQGIDIPRNGLDDIQYENVCKAVMAKDYYLIQGPPGTGKTSKVLAEIVSNISKSDSDIMVVAYTNRAVDEISEKLLSMGIDCIRLGKGDKPYYWSSLSNELNLNELDEKVKNNRVFVSTISTFLNSLDLLKFKNFETLIVDEASQVMEPQIIGILKYFKKWIFIGDENQLPAVVLQSTEDSKCDIPELNELSLYNYRESLFYRLKKNAINKSWDDCYGTLKYQYRMHVDIADFPKRSFYNNLLQEGDESLKVAIPDYTVHNNIPINQFFTDSRIVFVPSKKDIRSKINDEEAKLVAKIIEHIAHIYDDKFDPLKTVGVITPFRAQIANIRNFLGDKFGNVTIDTVERFQGSERDIIIVSFAIKSITQLGVIQSINYDGVDRKLNVAITRAKDHLILIGTEDVLEKEETFKKLIDFIKSRNGYLLNPIKLESLPDNLF